MLASGRPPKARTPLPTGRHGLESLAPPRGGPCRQARGAPRHPPLAPLPTSRAPPSRPPLTATSFATTASTTASTTAITTASTTASHFALYLRQGDRDQYLRLSHERRKKIEALLPVFDDLLKKWRDAQKEQGALMEKQDNAALLDTGDEILRHFREEREQSARLLGDEPPPPGVDEERLELAMLKVREAQRKGWLESARNDKNWKEFRRRQKAKRTEYEEATGKPHPPGMDVMDL